MTFTKALSQLAIEQGIRVNAIAPGPVWTPLIPSTMPDEKVKHFGESNQMKRPAQPAELAPAYVFSGDPGFAIHDRFGDGPHWRRNAALTRVGQPVGPSLLM